MFSIQKSRDGVVLTSGHRSQQTRVGADRCCLRDGLQQSIKHHHQLFAYVRLTLRGLFVSSALSTAALSRLEGLPRGEGDLRGAGDDRGDRLGAGDDLGDRLGAGDDRGDRLGAGDVRGERRGVGFVSRDECDAGFGHLGGSERPGRRLPGRCFFCRGAWDGCCLPMMARNSS